jgi:hypothetical protein
LGTQLTRADIETIDSSLNSGLRTVIIYVANLFGALAVVAVIVPWFLLPAAIISWLYLQYSILYVSYDHTDGRANLMIAVESW